MRLLKTTCPTKQTRGFEVIAWIEANCIHTQAEWYGKPFKLFDWQRKLLLDMFKVDENGKRIYQWAYISLAKKNGKTELLAALALWFLLASGENSPLIVVAAGSDDQADLLFQAAKCMAEESPTLKALCETGENLILAPSIPGGMIQRVSATARKHSSNLDGKNIFVVIADELHVWEGDKGRTIWGVLTRGTVARREPYVIQITTAGYDRTSICGEQYAKAKEYIADPTLNPRYFAWIVEPEPGADYKNPEIWKQCNPSYGIISNEDFYADQITQQPEAQFRRYYLNEWVEGGGSWVDRQEWKNCISNVQIPDGAPIFVGVDAAESQDHTAVAWVWVDNSKPEPIRVVRAHIFPLPPEGQDFNLYEAEHFIKELAKRYRVVAVGYDPFKFNTHAFNLESDGFTVVKFPQNNERMVPASEYTKREIRAARVAHDNNEQLTQHVANTVTRFVRDGERIDKGSEKIDGTVAMVLAMGLSGTMEVPEQEKQYDFLIL